MISSMTLFLSDDDLAQFIQNFLAGLMQTTGIGFAERFFAGRFAAGLWGHATSFSGESIMRSIVAAARVPWEPRIRLQNSSKRQSSRQASIWLILVRSGSPQMPVFPPLSPYRASG